MALPTNVGPNTRKLFEFAATDPSLGKPIFSSRMSTTARDEVIAQLTFGAKYFLSRTSHKTQAEAHEDAAAVAVDEMTRMMSAKQKGQRRMSLSGADAPSRDPLEEAKYLARGIQRKNIQPGANARITYRQPPVPLSSQKARK